LLFELRVREQQGVAGKERLVADIEKTVHRHLPGKVTTTGLYVLLAFLIDSLLGDQQLAFAVSAVGIFVMTTLAFRDVRLGFVAFAPNLVPIIVVLGAMGWFGLRINVATAMIGSISMGLVVDFSIHYLNRFRQERQAGHGFYLAMARTHMSTGKAMVFANLALMIGFGILATSKFIPTMHFGMLVSLAILGGLVGNLSILPMLLRLVYWVKRPEVSAFVDPEQSSTGQEKLPEATDSLST
jgi:predicted RND superfamily exporter protein